MDSNAKQTNGWFVMRPANGCVRRDGCATKTRMIHFARNFDDEVVGHPIEKKWLTEVVRQGLLLSDDQYTSWTHVLVGRE